MFDVPLAFEKRLDKVHLGFFTPFHPLSTTVPFKLLLLGLILSGLCLVNVVGGGLAFFLIIDNVITSENDISISIPTCAIKGGCKIDEGR